MGEKSTIEWTDATVNFWWGCTKVGPGCEHCYADAWARRWDAGVTNSASNKWHTFVHFIQGVLEATEITAGTSHACALNFPARAERVIRKNVDRVIVSVLGEALVESSLYLVQSGPDVLFRRQIHLAHSAGISQLMLPGRLPGRNTPVSA